MPTHSTDGQLLERALELARQGIGLASPNPHVGAVITDAYGQIVGEGSYTYAGVKHAEVLALEAARERARGGTLYINLEPHAHQGRTPPCTDALIAAGILRVVASIEDPNPKVSGRGFERLRAAGMQVEVGGLQQQAERLNEAFARYVRRGVPFVTLKSAMTLDGKIAPVRSHARQETNDSFTGSWITGEPARAHVHQLRHEHDAILVGIGTVLADNPLLTDRSGSSRRRPLLRVILDSHLRLPIESQLVKSAAKEHQNDVLVFCTALDEKKKGELERSGVRVEKVAQDQNGRVDMTAVLRCLREVEITSLMIEGGASINAAALAGPLVDKLFLYHAPTVLGSGIPFLANAGPRNPVGPLELKNVSLHRFGQDFAVEGYLRDPYRD